MGAGDRSAGDVNLRELLRRRAEEAPAAAAAHEPDGRTWTYAELQAVADDLRLRLPARRGRVGLRIPNTPRGVAAVHAVWQHGSSAVLIGPAIPARERERRLAEVGCRAIVDVDTDRVELRASHPTPAEPGHDEALVIFTSGTTGRPKGAALSFRALSSSVASIAEAVGMADGRLPTVPARSPSPTFMPLSHVGGLLGTVSAMYLGKPSLIVDKWRVDQVFDLVDRFQLTLLRLAPAMLYDLAHVRGERSLHPVKTISVGSAALSEAIRRRVEERYGVTILNNYGQTEVSGAIAFERYEDVRAGRRPPGSVGRIAPGVQVRIVAADGSDAAPGAAGEIFARSGSALDAYLQDGVAVDPRRDGWIATGDLGRLDGEGFLYLLGRVRDVIVCGGFNVYPAVVERALVCLPGILDAAVVGLPDDRLGEVPVAAVVKEATAPAVEDLLELLREDLAPYELPRRIVATAAIPLTAGGKPDGDGVRRLVAAQSSAAG